MADVQIRRTANGEELVVVSRQDYDARKLELAESGEVALPTAVAAALLKGDSLLKAIRRWRGLSQTEVAKRTGIG